MENQEWLYIGYSVEEDLAELLDILENTVRKMLGSGELPAKKIARRWYVSNQALINWFNTSSEEYEEE